MWKLLLCALLLALGACAANEDQRLAQIRADIDARCRNYGYTPGSVAFAQCRQSLDQQQMNAGTANRAAALNYMLMHR